MSTAGTTPPRKRNWMGIALVLSLAVNLLALGLLAGVFWQWSQGGGHGGKYRAYAAAIDQVISELPAGRQAAARAIVEKHRTTAQPLRQEIRDARRQARTIMKADDFDAEAMKAALDRIGAAKVKQRQSLVDMTVELSQTLSGEERRKLMTYFMKKWKKGGGWRKRGDSDEDGRY